MRFALMTEPQQGLTLRRAAGDRAPRRGRRLRDVLPVRPLPELSRARPATRRPTPGRSLAGLARDTDRIGLGVLVSPVTFRHTGNLAKVDHDRRRDERWPDRVRARRRLARRRACPARAAVPGDRGARRHARGEPRRSCSGCGASRTAGRSRASTSRSATRSSTRSRSTCPAARACPNGASRPRHPRRRRWDAAVDADRGALRGRVQSVVVVTGRRPREVRRSWRRPARRSAVIRER